MPSEADLEDVKSVIRATLISNHNRRTTIRDLAEQYKLIEYDEIPVRQFGYSTLYDFLLAIPDTVKLLDRSNRNSFVEPVVSEQAKHVLRLVKCQKPRRKMKRTESRARRPSFCVYPPISNRSMNSNTVISEKSMDDDQLTTHPQKEIPIVLICRLVKLLRTNEYIQSGSLFETYKKLYSEQLRPESFGFTSEEKFLQYLQSTFMVDEVDSGLSSSVSPLEDVTREPFLLEICGGDFHFETDPSFEKLEKGDCFDVYLGEIFSLDEFYVTFSSKVQLLDRMMTELNEFYKNNEEKYKIQCSLVSPDLPCVCPYSKTSQWHRACVVSHSHSLKSAKIVFIDYGTTEIVNIHQLRFLHKKFAEHPRFSMPARLSGIRPTHKQGYSDQAKLEFLRLFGDHNLEAEVVRKTSRDLEIFLYAFDGKRKITVHEELISKHLVLPMQDALLKEPPISYIIDEIMSRLTAASKSSFVSPIPPQVVPTVSPSPPLPPFPPTTISSFPKGAQTPAYVRYPPQIVGSYSFSPGAYNGIPFFMPRLPYQFIPPFQNSGYLPPYQPSISVPRYQYSGPRNLFRPPPGSSLPSFPTRPQFRPNVNVTPFSNLSANVSQEAADFRDQVELTVSLSSHDVYSNNISDCAKNCLIDDRTEELNENDMSLHQSSHMDEEIILKELEEFPILVNKSIPEQKALKNEVYECDVGLREDDVRETEDRTLESSWERKAVESKLMEFLELDEDGGDEVDPAHSKLPSSTKLNVLANEFTPKTKPPTSSTTINTNAPCATPEKFSSTGDGSAKKLKQLQQLRAFVLEHQAKNCDTY